MAALSYYVFSIIIVCSIGFHSTFLNKATIAIGIYVTINKGKVKVYSIFSKKSIIIISKIAF